MTWFRNRLAARPLRQARRIVIAIVGGSILSVGAIMIIVPGPASLLIPSGLGILALEFAWARRLLLYLRARASQGVSMLKGKRPPPPAGPA